MLKAVILDLNGTMLDDEDVYNRAFRRVLGTLGIRTKDNFRHTKGIGVRGNWLAFKSGFKFKSKKNLDELSFLTQKAYLEEFGSVKLRRGFLKLIKNLRLLGIKTALATSNDYSVVERVFDKFGIEKYFDVVASSEEVFSNKPSPQIFTLTAEKLGVEPYECLVFEDSKAGIEAARLAGMAVVGVASKNDQEDLLSLKDADRVIYSFDKFKLFSKREYDD